MDDSVSYQVYNNIAENRQSILLSRIPMVKVVNMREMLYRILFFYFCGHTTEAQYVWPNGSDIPYLKGS